MMGSEISDTHFAKVLIQSLPPSWDTFTQSLIGSRRISNLPEDADKTVPLYSSHKICGILLEEYKQRLDCGQIDTVLYFQGRPKTGKKPMKNTNQNSSDQGRPICNNCGKAGHFAKDCWFKGVARRAKIQNGPRGPNWPNTQTIKQHIKHKITSHLAMILESHIRQSLM